jgi:hypothetical protein
MLDPDGIRRLLKDMNPPVTTLSDLVSMSAIAKNLADADKSALDALDAQRKSEVLRFWIPVLAPTVTAFALIATLAIQMYQIRANAIAQESVAEDVAWRDATKNLTVASGAGIPIGLHQLRPFLKSLKYGRITRELIITLIAETDSASFAIVLPDVLRDTTWTNFADITRLERGLDSAWTRATNARRDAQVALDAITAETDRPFGHTDRLRNAQQQLAAAQERQDDIVGNLGATARGIADFIRVMKQTRPNGDLDLRNAGLLDADFSKLELYSVNLSDVILRRVDVSKSCICSTITVDAELSPSSFAESVWTGTAWWRADEVSPALLNYLEHSYPYDSKVRYAGGLATAGEYASALQRLHSKNEERKASAQQSPTYATTGTPSGQS